MFRSKLLALFLVAVQKVVADVVITDITGDAEGFVSEDRGIAIGATGYIVGGEEASSNEAPWFVHFGSGICGGSLIAPNRVLTAAHCVRQGAPANVRIGATTQSNGEVIDVRCANIHPDYNGVVFNDLAVLKLSKKSSAQTVPLNADKQNPGAAGQDLTVYGLGRTSTGGPVSSKLMKVTQGYVSPSDCDDAYGGEGDVNPNQILCALTADEGSCNGDSGGPQIDANGTQVGIVSFGSSRGCAANIPDGYTRISTYVGWIQEQIDDDGCDGCSVWPWDWCAQVRDSVVTFARGLFK